MNAEILSVGTVILLGEIANTDAQFISEGLSELGINVYFHTVTGDNPERLKQAFAIAKERADIIITTGGLGPTYDDLTKETLAGCFGKKLVVHEPSYQKIIKAYEKMGRPMTSNNKKQAMLPEDCTVFLNDWGMAPGCAFFAEGKHIIMLPGPPRECKPMFFERAKPYLESLSDGVIVSSVIKIYGMGESAVEELLRDEIEKMENPSVAPYAKEGECQLRVTAKAENKEKAREMLAPVVKHMCERLGDSVYGVDVNSIEEVTVRLMNEKKLTFAAAESCTGGLVTKRFTDISGSSTCIKGGVCAYSNEVKIDVVGVSAGLIEHHGAVSEEVARAMAEGIRSRFHADIGLGITGVAGPQSSEGKPAGLVYIAVCSKDGTEVKKIEQSGDRQRVRMIASSQAINLVRRATLKL